MKIDYDYHTHTTFSHGKGTILENSLSAADKGIKGIGITDHGFSHPVFGMRRRKLDLMRKECDAAEKQSGIKVYLGIESNIMGVSGKTDLRPKDYEKIDLFLAGVHKFVFCQTPFDFVNLFCGNYLCDRLNLKPSKSLIEYTTKCYINAIKNNPIDIITHLNYRCFADCREVAKCCADYGTYIEFNTKKVHMTDDEWQQVIDTGVNFVIDSDAHSIDRVGDVSLFIKEQQRLNIPTGRIFNIENRTPNFRFAEYKKRL